MATATKIKRKAGKTKKEVASKEKLKKLEAASVAPVAEAPNDVAVLNGGIAVNQSLYKKWSEWPTEMIDCDKIEVGTRYRKDPGDIHKLAKSINDFGLLQPIGVQITDDGYRLVAGRRRLMAVSDVLKHPQIKATIFDPDVDGEDERMIKFKQMELEENEREQPSMRERLAFCAEIDGLLGAGKKTVPAGKKRREVVAAAGGFSHETRRQADIVFSAGDKNPELAPIAEAMDKGELAPTAAYKKVVAHESSQLDGAGVPIPKKCRAAFVSRAAFEALIKDSQTFNRFINDLCNTPGGERLATLTATGQLAAKTTTKDGVVTIRYSSPHVTDLIHAMTDGSPFAQCPVCAQKANELGHHYKTCETCKGSGHISESVYENLKKVADPSLAVFEALGKAALKA